MKARAKSAAHYRKQWQRYRPGEDGPEVESVTERIHAPPGFIRVCAYHIDFDERPTLFQDVRSADEAAFICRCFRAVTDGFNVDYAEAFDENAQLVEHNRPY